MDQNKITKELLRFLVIVFIWIVAGRIPAGDGYTLENRYHEWVNSSGFVEGYRKGMWYVTRPLTWTGEQITSLFPKNYSLEKSAEEVRGKVQEKYQEGKERLKDSYNQTQEKARAKIEDKKNELQEKSSEKINNLKESTQDQLSDEIDQFQEDYLGGR